MIYEVLPVTTKSGAVLLKTLKARDFLKRLSGLFLLILRSFVCLVFSGCLMSIIKRDGSKVANFSKKRVR